RPGANDIAELDARGRAPMLVGGLSPRCSRVPRPVTGLRGRGREAGHGHPDRPGAPRGWRNPALTLPDRAATPAGALLPAVPIPRRLGHCVCDSNYEGVRPMSLVVQKFGGSSVADAAAMKRVAERISLYAKAGHQVVVVVSAMGDTTDELIDLADEISPNPPPREMDMLITAGERMSMAVLSMALNEVGVTARAYTGSQAGLITD